MKSAVATLAGGCFWCTEAIYQRIEGVSKVVSGYTGGSVPDPSYEQVSSGTTGHAEAVQVHFDPQETSFEKILDIFWKTHDPTTPNRQGTDVGTQYRSAIFYHNGKQKELAEKSKQAAQKNFDSPIVTEIVPFGKFYPAEDYHQDYYENNRNKPYCRLVIDPKLKKLEKLS